MNIKGEQRNNTLTTKRKYIEMVTIFQCTKKKHRNGNNLSMDFKNINKATTFQWTSKTSKWQQLFNELDGVKVKQQVHLSTIQLRGSNLI
jgi:hypothetical protein